MMQGGITGSMRACTSMSFSSHDKGTPPAHESSGEILQSGPCITGREASGVDAWPWLKDFIVWCLERVAPVVQ